MQTLPAQTDDLHSAASLLQQIGDRFGTFAFAVSGALLAVEKRFDIVGIAVLAAAPAIGGGVVRDLVIGRLPPVAFTDLAYLGIALAAAVLIFVWHPPERFTGRPLDIFDALGLGVFYLPCTTTGVHPEHAGRRPTTTPRDEKARPCPACPARVSIPTSVAVPLPQRYEQLPEASTSHGIIVGSTRIGRVDGTTTGQHGRPHSRPTGCFPDAATTPAARMAGNRSPTSRSTGPSRPCPAILVGTDRSAYVVAIEGGVVGKESNHGDQPDFEALYRGVSPEPDVPSLIPWDIGGPQPVVQQLVSCGGLRGEVLDPGTGLGYHAIHFASKGYSATGIDASPTAIEQARRNAERAGVSVDFQVADATRLDGLENRFDTVVDSAFYHVFLDDEPTQTRYVQALHRATKPGARLFMFEIGRHNVNGLQPDGLPAENFHRVLPAAGWRVDYLGTTTYQATFSPETFARLSEEMGAEESGWAERMKPLQEQIQVIAPLLKDNRIHLPVWAVTATRLD